MYNNPYPDNFALLQEINERTANKQSVNGAGLDEGSKDPRVDMNNLTGNQMMGRGAISSMNAGGSAGQALTSAGIAGTMGGAALGPWGMAAGTALTMLESSNKAKAQAEQARVQEAVARKEAVQGALNQALGATRQLGV